MKRADLERELKKVGWRFERHGGSHDIWTNGADEIAVPSPGDQRIHSQGDLAAGKRSETMRFAGRVVKSGKWYAAEVPVLGIDTQGRNKAHACTMVKDAIESLINKPGFVVTIYPGRGSYFEVGANDHAAWVAFLLRRQRMIHGLSLADVAERLGAKSRNAYARYERGQSVPTADRLMELLAALEPGRDFVLGETGT